MIGKEGWSIQMYQIGVERARTLRELLVQGFEILNLREAYVLEGPGATP
jgi:hypothetical protein